MAAASAVRDCRFSVPVRRIGDDAAVFIYHCRIRDGEYRARGSVTRGGGEKRTCSVTGDLFFRTNMLTKRIHFKRFGELTSYVG